MIHELLSARFDFRCSARWRRFRGAPEIPVNPVASFCAAIINSETLLQVGQVWSRISQWRLLEWIFLDATVTWHSNCGDRNRYPVVKGSMAQLAKRCGLVRGHDKPISSGVASLKKSKTAKQIATSLNRGPGRLVLTSMIPLRSWSWSRRHFMELSLRDAKIRDGILGIN